MYRGKYLCATQENNNFVLEMKLIGKNFQFTTQNKLLLYKVILKAIWTYSFGAQQVTLTWRSE